MFRLLETIKCIDGKLQNLNYHQQRVEKSVAEIYRSGIVIDLANEISIPGFAKNGLYKCRLVYSNVIEKADFSAYQFRQIKSLKVVEANKIDYHLKFENRLELEQLFSKRGDCDDIIIVKNGLVTDSFAANLVFFDGTTWWTPNSPLLPGTQRKRLLDTEKISEQTIRIKDLHNFQKAGLINAFNSIEEMPLIDVADIVF